MPKLVDNVLTFTLDGRTVTAYVHDPESDTNVMYTMGAAARRLIYELGKTFNKPVHSIKLNITLCNDIIDHPKRFDADIHTPCLSIRSKTFEERGYF